ncbi:MAG: ammonium transporter [Nitrosopumilus sp.]|nr:ammonium transporter [Nitrosopumilus sp.]MDH3737090.1 ammonium transporter [Nitrosopumilus sp.]MDH3822119.1 ammonium transporter [Nitrosopumilus sp.]MDH3834043.1 ammonium transporter [Nitrosopumilus sp.]
MILWSIGYAFDVTIVILKVMDVVWPDRIKVTPKEEWISLDLAQHGEIAYVNE